MGGKRGNFQKAFTDEAVTQAKLLATVMRRNCKGASSFQNKLREPCRMYFWFEWEIPFIQDFKETSISPSPREAHELFIPQHLSEMLFESVFSCTGPP